MKKTSFAAYFVREIVQDLKAAKQEFGYVFFGTLFVAYSLVGSYLLVNFIFKDIEFIHMFVFMSWLNSVAFAKLIRELKSENREIRKNLEA
jgi:hypothetical protein